MTGVALLIHGMNLKPDRMGAITARLTRAGIHVLACTLFGHGDNFEPLAQLSDTEARLEGMRQVTYERWRTETAAAHAEVCAAAEALGDAPILLVGFSLGCLMGCSQFACNPALTFDRMLFFAPALRIRRHAYLPRLLSSYPRFIVPSLAPRAYRANRGASVAAYCALYAALDDFSENLSARLNVPTLIFCDPKDELISYIRLRELIAEAELTRWQIHPVGKEETVRRQYHHLVIDPSSVGENVWKDMMDLAVQHLTSNQPVSTPSKA